MNSFRQRLVAIIVIVGAGTALFFGSLGTALATSGGNNIVISSNPAPNQVVGVPPTQIQMVFRDPLPSAAAAASMGMSLACNGAPVGLAPAQLGTDSVTVSAALTQIPQTGQCTVSWSLPDRSVGSFSFMSTSTTETTLGLNPDGSTIIPDAPAVIGETVPTVSGGGPRVGGILGLLRVIEYFLLASLFGGLIVILFVWPEGVDYGETLRFFRITWIASAMTTYFVVAITAMRISGDGFATSINPFTWFGVLNDAGGLILLLRFALVIASVWVAWNPLRIFDPVTQVPAVTLVVAMISTLGLSRLGQNVALLVYVFGIAHAISMAVWLGGLVLLSRAVLTDPGEEDLLNAVRGFAKFSVPIFAVTVLTGAMQIYLLDGANIFASGHGRVSLLKILVVAMMIFIGLVFRAFALGRLDRETELKTRMAWRLRRAVSVQVAFAIIALALTSWMAPMRPPLVNAASPAPAATYLFRQELSNDKFSVVLSITPGTTGINAMRIELLQPSRINNFFVNLVPQSIGFAGISVHVPLKRRGAAIVMGDGLFVFNTPGVWTIEITGTTTTGDLVPLATTITITDATLAASATTLPEVIDPTGTTVAG